VGRVRIGQSSRTLRQRAGLRLLDVATRVALASSEEPELPASAGRHLTASSPDALSNRRAAVRRYDGGTAACRSQEDE
jgi:hypothetical protein